LVRSVACICTYLAENSLEWESFEQVYLWQLVASEFSARQSDIEPLVRPLLRIITPNENQEAILGATSLLKDMTPTKTIVDAVVSLSSAFGRFAPAILANWTRNPQQSITVTKFIVDVSYL
jgi:hypothetical protein